jgi:hypothetical protein
MAPPDPLDEVDDSGEESGARRIIRTHLIQISIISMHQNGRDTHIRQVQLYGPRTATAFPSFQNEATDDPNRAATDLKQRHLDEEFSTLSMSQYSVLR